jgi:DNA gyrase subunit A
MEKFGLSEIQAKAILEMRLRVLTGLERDKIKAEFDELMKLIAFLKNILEDEGVRMQIIKDELAEMRDKYGDERRTEIVYAGGTFRMEDMIENEEVVITVSHAGYIKRTALSEYRVQGRGGKGSMGSNSRDEDFIEHLFIASTHNYLLFFTEQGRCHWLKVYEIPEGTRTSKGRAIQNLINISKEDKVKAFINVDNLTDEEYLANNYIIMCTKNGTIKKTLLDAYSNPRVTGINAITINEGDQLLEVLLTNGQAEIVMALKSGRAIRFNESTVRPMGRTAAGVRGITLGGATDEVIGMIGINDPATTVLVVSEKGYGKRSDIDDYRVTNRGGKGVKTINITDKTGNLIGIKAVNETDQLMIINKSGLTIRMEVVDLRVMGRATQGVRLIKLNEDDEIASLAKIAEVKEDELVIGEDIVTSSNELNEPIDNTDYQDNTDTNTDTEIEE